MKFLKTLRKRGLALFLVLTMCLSVMQVTAFAADSTDSVPEASTNDQNQDSDGIQTPNQTEESEESDKTDGSEESDKTDGTEESDKTDGTEESDKTDGTEESDKTDGTEESDKTDGTEESDKTDGTEESDKTDGTEESDKTDGSEESGKTDGTEESEETVSEEVTSFLTQVANLPAEITTDAEGAITAAREAYDSLTDEEKADAAVVEALETLKAAEAALEAAKEAAEKKPTFDEETGTLTITGMDEVTKADVQAYKSKAQNVVITDVGTIAKDAFSEWKLLKTVDISNVGTIGYAFRSTSVEKVTIDNVDKIETYAFFNSPSLTTVSISNVKNVGDTIFSVYGGKTSLTTVSLKNTYVGSQMFKDHVNLVNLTLENVDTIGFQAFMNCTALSFGNLDANQVKSLGTSAFLGCTGLTDVTLDGVKLGSTAFYGCTGLTSVTLKNMDAVGVNAFHGCTGLETVTFENIKTVGDKPLVNCTNVKTVILTNVDTIGDTAFSGCASLETLEMTDIAHVGKSAFSSCTGLKTVNMTNVTINGSDYYVNTETGYQPPFANAGAPDMTLTVKGGAIGTYAFWKCTGLTDAQIENVDTIGQYAFSSCTSLESVGMTGVKVIDNYAFWSCSNLKTIDSLSNVTERIGGFAFYGCKSLTGLTVAVLTKMGYIGSSDEIMQRVKDILAGKFQLDDAASIEELTEESGWDASDIGRSKNWDQYDDGAQLMEQARWSGRNSPTAEIKVDAYYTAEQQMDYIFVADLSASMAQLGNPEDSNARFYDMQSKLLDMTGKLLETPGYDCRVSIVTFGGEHNNNATVESMNFTGSASEAEEYIMQMEPLNENTDYGLGLQRALELAQGNTGRQTVVVFLSDGQPNRGTSGDQDGTTAAAVIRALNVPIYGVLHSPAASQHDAALAKMQAVCGENTVYESTDTESFGEAMNAAFAAAYGSHVVKIPVGGSFDVSGGIEVTSGEAVYDAASNTITWTINGMPFTKHTLTCGIRLQNQYVDVAGTYAVNSAPVTIGTGEAAADVTVSVAASLVLDYVPASAAYTYTVTYTDGAGGTVFADQVTENILTGSATPAFVGTPARAGYVFTGWSPAVAAAVTANATYTAQWSEDANGNGVPDENEAHYTVTYTDGAGGTVFADQVTENILTGAATPAFAGTPVRAGYTFAGWTPAVAAAVAADATYTAQWTAVPVVVPPVNPVTPVTPAPAPGGTTIIDDEVPLANVAGLDTTAHFAYIQGYDDGTVRPLDNMSRAEVATLFLRLMTEEYRVTNWATSNSFTDAVAGDWYNIAVSTAAKAGLIKGYTDGTVRPDDYITHAEFVTLAARFASEDLNDEGVGDFTDTAGHWAAKEIRMAAKAGWISWVENGNFRPDEYITRAEVMVMVNRMLDRVPSVENMLPGMKTWSDNPEGTSYYADVLEATNDHAHERGEDGVSEIWTELTEAKDWDALMAEWTANNGASAAVSE